MARGDVLMKFDANTHDFITKVTAAAKALQAAGGAAEDAGKKVDKGGLSFKDFGQTAADSFGLPLTPLDGFAKGLDLVKESFASMNREMDEGANSLRSMEEQLRRLIQVSGNLADFQKLKAKATEISTSTGVSQDMALKMMFEARSQGLEDKVDYFAGASKVVDPLQAMTAVGKMQAAFGKEAGSAEQLVPKILAGAKDSNADFETLARNLPTAAQPVSRLGGSDEELIATLSVFSQVFKGAETGAQRIKGFASQAAARGFGEGKGLLGAFEAFEALPESKKDEFMRGNQEAAEAVTAFRGNLPLIRGRERDILAAQSAVGTSEGLVERGIGIGTADEEANKIRQSNIEAQKLEAAKREAFGATRLGQDATIARQQRESIEGGEDPYSRLLRGGFAAGGQAAGVGEEGINTLGEMGGNAGRLSLGVGMIARTMRKLFGAADNLEASTHKPEARDRNADANEGFK